MSQISENTKKSGVKILCSILLITQFTFTHTSHAMTDEEYKQRLKECKEEKADENARGEDKAACYRAVESDRARDIQANKDQVTSCRDANQAVTKARSELAKKCGEAGLPKECQDEASNCIDASGEDAYNSIGSYAEAAGYGQYSTILNTALGGNKKTENGVCAKYSSKDYATEKKEITKDLEKVAEDLADMTRKKAKLQKDFAKDMQDIQKKVDDAQEELEKQKLKIKDSKRERLANFQNNQNQQKDTLRQKNMSILDIKGKIITSDRDKAMKLVALTDASGKRTCMTEYNKARANYQKTSSSSTSNFVASSSAKKNDLIAIYTDCMAIFQQQRVALNESKKQEIDALNAQLANLQSEVDELTSNMELASNQLAEMEQDAATEQSQAEQKVIKLMQTSQQEMLTAQQELTSNVEALTQEETNLKSKQNRLNNSLMTMGPVPKSGSKSTPESIASEAGSLAEDVTEAQEKFDNLECSKVAGYNNKKIKGKK